MSDWIQWYGDGCPVAASEMVEVRFRNGDTASGRADTWDMLWNHQSIPPNIVAYRVIGVAPATAQSSALNVQEGGSHYKTLAIQPVEYIHKNGIGYFEGNVIKYVTRWKNKSGLADLKKARHYIDLLIELEGGAL